MLSKIKGDHKNLMRIEDIKKNESKKSQKKEICSFINIVDANKSMKLTAEVWWQE